MNASLVKKSLLFVVVIFFLNLLAYKFYWYTSIWYFDMVMHAAGGVFLALLIGAKIYPTLTARARWQSFVGIVLGVFIIGLLWEYFEYIVQAVFKPTPFADIPDSISDLLCDVIGGAIGTIFVLHGKKRYNRDNG